jgi:hypothetical protein
MEERPDQRPEGKLIAASAERLDLSIREAAKRAGISYGRWRQIVTGYQNVSPGSVAAVRAPARTLAKMAAVVGITAEQMETDGQRPDAAEILREMLRGEASEDSRPDTPRERTLPIIAALLAAPGIDGYLAEVRAERNGGGFAVRDDEELRIWADPLLREDEKRTLVAYGRLEQDKAVRSSREDAGLMRA